MSGQPGQMSPLPTQLPEEYSLDGLPEFDGRSRIAKSLVKRQEAFAKDPDAVLREDLLRCYHGLTLWRQDKESRLRVRKASLETDKIYLGLTNAWLGVYSRVAGRISNDHTTAEERTARALFAEEPHP